MKCTACSHDNRPDAVHCTSCGALLPIECERCGTLAPAGQANCHNCGNALPGVAGPATQAPAPAQATTGPLPQIRCTYCNTLNDGHLSNCSACGAAIALAPAGQIPGVAADSDVPDGTPGRRPRPLAAYYEPPSLVTKLSAAGLGIIALVHLINVIRLIGGYDLFDSSVDLRSRADSYDNFGAIIGFAMIGSYLVTGVVFLIWQWRSSKNMRLLDVGNAVVSPGWGVGLWLIPVVNFVSLYIALRELNAKVGRFSSIIIREALVAAWWGSFWLAVAVFIANPQDGNSVSGWREWTGYLIGGNLLLALSAICAAIIVLKITGGSELRAFAVVAEWQREQEAEPAQQEARQDAPAG